MHDGFRDYCHTAPTLSSNEQASDYWNVVLGIAANAGYPTQTSLAFASSGFLMYAMRAADRTVFSGE